MLLFSKIKSYNTIFNKSFSQTDISHHINNEFYSSEKLRNSVFNSYYVKYNEPCEFHYNHLYDVDKLKYYLVFRYYQKFHEDVPSMIKYYSTGEICSEYWKVDGKYYRKNGPARITYYKDGKISSKYYHDRKCLTNCDFDGRYNSSISVDFDDDKVIS